MSYVIIVIAKQAMTSKNILNWMKHTQKDLQPVSLLALTTKSNKCTYTAMWKYLHGSTWLLQWSTKIS